MAAQADDVGPLVARAAAGDQAAWDEIVARYTNLLWSVGRGYRLDTASIADVIQVTWLRLLENITRIREPERLAGWLVTTARRECLSVLRRSGRELPGWEASTFETVGDDAVPAVDLDLLGDEQNSALWQCFVRLSERCQRLLRVLMAVDSPRYAEVSQALGLPVGSIGPTRMRCLEQLRRIMAATDYPFETALGGTS